MVTPCKKGGFKKYKQKTKVRQKSETKIRDNLNYIHNIYLKRSVKRAAEYIARATGATKAAAAAAAAAAEE